MLTSDDVVWIKSNRADIEAERTESVTFTRETVTGNDPYTNEPIITPVTSAVSVVWKELSVENVAVLQGVDIRKGDVKMTVDGAEVIPTVTNVLRNSVNYRIITYTERGLGGKNRYECVVRRVT